MLKVAVPYGGGFQSVELPDGAVVLRPADVTADDEDKVLENAWAEPLQNLTLEGYLCGARRVTVIVNDAFRATPTARVLRSFPPFIKDYELTVLIATGNHRPCTAAEIQTILGEADVGRVVVHSSTQADASVFLGETGRGTPVWFNRAVTDADRVVVIGSVEPHYFAGFTGGRKSFLPGVSALETIRSNHRWALSPHARLGRLEGNPVHEDMEEAAALSPVPAYGMTLVLDGEDRVYAARSGPLGASFAACLGPAADVYGAAVDKRYDVVVTVAPPPLDANLYQTHKAVEAASLIVRDGGVIIWVSACREGIGDPAFFDILQQCRRPGDAARVVGDGYEVGWHQPVRLAAIAERARLLAVTELEEDVVRRTFARPFRSLADALREAGVGRRGEGPSVIFLLSGSTQLPLFGPGVNDRGEKYESN